MDTAEAVSKWAEVWTAGWRGHDVEAIAALYARDCIHRSTPFRRPHQGREGVADYLRWAFAGDREVREVRFGSPVVAGDRASVEYWAMVVDEQGEPVTLAGCCMLRFTPDGEVSEARDYWHLHQDHASPPTDWGRQ